MDLYLTQRDFTQIPRKECRRHGQITVPFLMLERKANSEEITRDAMPFMLECFLLSIDQETEQAVLEIDRDHFWKLEEGDQWIPYRWNGDRDWESPVRRMSR